MTVYLSEAVGVTVWFIVLWSGMNRIEEVYLMDWQGANGTMYVTNVRYKERSKRRYE